MAELRIRVGAAVDSSFSHIFRDIASASSSAQKKISSDEKAAASLHQQLLQHKWSQEKAILGAEITETSKVNDRIHQLRMARAKADIRASEEAAKAERSAAVRGAENTARDVERIQRRSSDGRFSRRMGYWSMRNFSPVVPMLSLAGRAASDLARGAGVNFDVGSMLSKTVNSEKLATDISNAGYLQGDTRNGQRINAADLVADARKAGNAAAIDPNEALGGLKQFTGISGDLATGREILADMAKYSRATGSSLEDMMAAAGNVANDLGDMKDKGEIIKSIMSAIAGQGKLGAVEIRDMASQMAKLAAIAPQFAGSLKENIVGAGVLAQEARQRGGASSATQAATSVMSFANTFSKGKRLDAFKALGIQTEVGGKTRNFEELILLSLEKTKGDNRGMGKLFADSGARRVTRGFENVYKESGGGQAGLAAVATEFDRLRKAAISEAEMQESLTRSMQTAEAKAQLFQNQLQEVVSTMAGKLMPALEQLAPKALEMVQAFGGIVTWAAANPMEAVVSALGVAIGKTAIEQTVRGGIEKMFAGAGLAGLTFTVAAATIMVASQIVADAKGKERGQDERINATVKGASQAAADYAVALDEPEDPRHPGAKALRVEEARRKLGMSTKELESLQAPGQKYTDEAGHLSGRLYHQLKTVGGTVESGEEALGKEAAKHLAEIRATLDRVKDVLGGSGKVFRVEVQNLPGGPGPRVNEDARSPDEGHSH